MKHFDLIPILNRQESTCADCGKRIRKARFSRRGWADAGEKVVVTFAGKTAEATPDDKGKWLVKLPELPASADETARWIATLTNAGYDLRRQEVTWR